MGEIALKLRILFRAEMALVRAEAQRRGHLAMLAAVSLGCVFVALAFVNVGVFFALTELPTYSRAAFILAGANLVLALIPYLLRQRSKPGSEEQMVREIRDMALEEVSKEIDGVAGNVAALRSGVASFAGGGLATLAPALTLVIDLLKKRRESRS